MKISKEKLSEYARLIVRTGANVQPGQVVQLSIAVEQHEFAAMITETGRTGCTTAMRRRPSFPRCCPGKKRSSVR